LVTRFPNHRILPKLQIYHPGLFSTLSRVKTWLMPRMSEGRGRLTGLALLHIHRDIPVSAQAVIERFAKRKKTLSRLRYLKHFETSLPQLQLGCC